MRNAFIPRSTELVERYPRKVLETPASVLWFKRDTKFATPKGYISARISTNE